jgi:GST-like protein
MIDLFYDATPNGRKILMMLEEIHIPYQLHWVEIDKGQQFNPAFRTLSPSAKIPAILDIDTSVEIFESGAILLYLAEKYGQLLPDDTLSKNTALSWLFWQTSTYGPMVGQATHFHSYTSQINISDSYASSRYLKIVQNLYQDLERRLATVEYIAGAFSIADIALYPWVRVAKGHGIDTKVLPNISKWADKISGRSSAKVKPPHPDGTVAFKTIQARDKRVWNALVENHISSDNKGDAS